MVKAAVWIGAIASLVSVTCAAPEGFGEREIFKDSRMTDMTWTSDGRMFVAHKLGLVHIYEPGTDYQYGEDKKTTVLDIENRVCFNGERGLTGIQVHPDFEQNNWV